MSLTNEPDRAALLDHDRRFFESLVDGDSTALNGLLADDFILVGIADGAVVGRSDLLAALSSGALQFPAIRSFPDEAIVRRVGHVGIVVGRTAITFTSEDATAFVSGSRYTHIFVRDDESGWQLLSAQGTEIKDADH